jgi:hypothetical protein
VSVELVAFHSYIVAAGFHIRADAIEAKKRIVAQVTALSLDEEGCQIYYWSLVPVMLSEAKHLRLFLGAEEQYDQGFFSRGCGIRMTEGKLCAVHISFALLCGGQKRQNPAT